MTPEAGATLDAWEVLGLGALLLIAVLTAYAAVIKWNYDVAHRLHNRLLGIEGDDTDGGFIQETEDRLERMESKVEAHARTTHVQLYHVDQKVNLILEHVDDAEARREVPDDVPPPSSRDFLRGGSGDRHPSPDGGEPVPEQEDGEDGESPS